MLDHSGNRCIVVQQLLAGIPHGPAVRAKFKRRPVHVHKLSDVTARFGGCEAISQQFCAEPGRGNSGEPANNDGTRRDIPQGAQLLRNGPSNTPGPAVPVRMAQ